MKNNAVKIGLFILIIFIGVIFKFFPKWLVVAFPFSETFPLGTIISWVGIIIYALFFYLIYQKKTVSKVIKNLLFVNLLFALSWGFVSFVLSGNWAFNFQGGNLSFVWKIYTGFIFLLPIVISIISVLIWIFKWIFKN